MNEVVLRNWVWWFLIGLLFLWWWPKHVAAFSASSILVVPEIRVGAISSGGDQGSTGDSPTLHLVSANWGVVTDSQERTLGIQNESGDFSPLTGCHVEADLDQVRLRDGLCLTRVNDPLSVPTHVPIYFQDNGEWRPLLPFTETPNQPGDVLITEVMWSGSYDGEESQAYDEWLELYNPRLTTLDLSQLEITRAGPGGDSLVIPAGRYLPPQGYLLIGARSAAQTRLTPDPDWVTSSMSLANSTAGITLVSAQGQLLDSLPSGPWRAGQNDTANQRRASAQRRSVLQPGDDWDNWATCSSDTLPLFDLPHWKSQSQPKNCGTPWKPSLY